MYSFFLVSLVLAAGLAFLAGSFHLLPQNSALQEKMPTWPRKPILPGCVIGVVALVWSAYHGCLMLEGPLEKLHPYVWILVPVSTILCILYLDYLNARAFGGFVTLAANFLIAQAFIHNIPCRGFYSSICLLIGVAGLVAIGLPWRIRDWFTIASKKPNVARISAMVLAAIAVLLVAFPGIWMFLKPKN